MTRTLFTNATFWPGQAKGKTFGAMLVDGQKIVAVGDEAQSAAHDKKVDLGGAFVSPSFGDGHCHPIFGGRQHFGPQVTDIASVDAILAEVKDSQQLIRICRGLLVAHTIQRFCLTETLMQSY